MSELQDALNKIMSDPEAMRQVQSLGEQLGLSGSAPAPQPPVQSVPGGNAEMMSALAKLAPLMSASAQNDETTELLNALRPFLSGEKLERLAHAEKLTRLIRLIPLLRDSGLFL